MSVLVDVVAFMRRICLSKIRIAQCYVSRHDIGVSGNTFSRLTAQYADRIIGLKVRKT
jgi:hypothetical protein